MGEESYKAGQQLEDTPTFIIDPIDGTLNFVSGFPNFAISLAFTVDKKPVVGVVYNPVRRDLFYAVKGSGAYIRRGNGIDQRLPASGKMKALPGLTGAMIAIEWGNQRKGPNWKLRTRVHHELLTHQDEDGKMCRSVRSNGSAALDMCYVAAGWFDMFWEAGCWAWDVAAGWIILEEAGGMVVSANPGDWTPSVEGRTYFAIRGAKTEEQKGVAEELWAMMGDDKFAY
ncbi:MAG: inositol monophosphatase [Terriglobus roseus]|nr:inositol monophosphatase [Terriglobus roseus]